MPDHVVDANKMVPPPHLLKKFSEQARVDSKKRGHSGYCKTFAKLCIDWALNSQPSAALAEQPVGPTDEELVKHYDRAVTSAIAIRVAVRKLTMDDRDAATVVGLRAVLARWGQP